MPNQVYSIEAKLLRSMQIGPTYRGERGYKWLAKTFHESKFPGETINIDFHDQNNNRVWRNGSIQIIELD